MGSIGFSRKMVRLFACFIFGVLSAIGMMPAIALSLHASDTVAMTRGGAQAPLSSTAAKVKVVQDLRAFKLDPQAASVIPAGLNQSPNPPEGSRGVIGSDDRQLMTSRSYPWSAIGRISGVSAEGDPYICSGTLIAPTVVLTNAHCVISPDTHQPSSQMVSNFRINFVVSN